MSGPLRLLLVGGNGAVRRGLDLLLSTEAGVSIVAQTEDGASAVKVGTDLKPNLVLVDLESLGNHALDTAEQIQRRLSTTVVVLSLQDDAGSRARVQEAGLQFISKQADTHGLLELLRKQAAD